MKTHELEKLSMALKQSGNRLTNPRKRVYEVLAENDAVSMAQLIELVAADVDRTSVYRTVELFGELGIIHRIHIGWKYKIELSEQYSHHHHHATCTKCGRSEVFKESQQIEDKIHELSDNLGYKLETHTLELRGVCKKCGE